MPFITILRDTKGKLRLRPLPNQEYNIAMNIQGSKEIRERYPTGTLLVAEYLLPAGSFYRAPKVRPALDSEVKEWRGLVYKAEGFEEEELNIFDVI